MRKIFSLNNPVKELYVTDDDIHLDICGCHVKNTINLLILILQSVNIFLRSAAIKKKRQKRSKRKKIKKILMLIN